MSEAKKTRTYLFFASPASTTMKTFAKAALTFMLLAGFRGSDSETAQPRGFDEGPWSMMNQQPEVLIVKEKGSSGGGSSGMKMKDITPVICLLAPLLLAAILLPAKMTMMMNGMMANGNGMMMNGMMPVMMPNGMPMSMLPFTALLTNGMSTQNPLGLPVSFKKLHVLSKEFSGKVFSEDGDEPEISNTTFSTNQTSRGDSTKNGTYYQNPKVQANLVPSKLPKYLRNNLADDLNMLLKSKGENEWTSRVWGSETEEMTTIADNILKFVEAVQTSLNFLFLKSFVFKA